MSIDVNTLENDGDLERVWNYTKISELPKSVFCEDLYYHQNGFKDGSYLIPYQRESFYDKRKEHQYLRNYLQKIVDTAYKDVFSQGISRDTDSELIQAFIENPMQNGESMSQCMKYASLFAINNGYVCTIVDNFQDLKEISQSELIASGELPYVYFRKPDTIESYKVDKFGLLESITFAEGKIEIDGKEVDYFKTWDYTNWRTFYKRGKKEITIDERPHGLKKFPVYVSYMGNKRNPDDFHADPLFYSIAVINFALWNLDSEGRDNILTNLFPILKGTGFGGLTALQVGSHGLLDMGDPENDISFMSPDTGTFSECREAKKELVEAMLQLAEQLGVTGVEKGASGTSKAYDFYASSTLKKEVSMKAKELESWIVGQVADYLNIEAYSYSADYPQTFLPNESEEFTTRLEKLDMVGIPRELKSFYLKKIALQDMTGEDPDEIKAVIEAIETEPDTLPE